MMKACVNGRLVDEGRATVSVLDYGLLYGYGLYETMRAENGVVFRLGRHLARLRGSAAEIDLPVTWKDSEIREAIRKTLNANKLRDAYVRLTVTRGASEPRLDLRKNVEPTIIVLCRPLPAGIGEKQRRGVKLQLSERYTRYSADVRSRVKSTNYLINALAKMEAGELGVDDVILLNEKGFVAECSTANIFLAKGGKLITPPVDSGVLPGITRGTVIEIAEEIGLKNEERKIKIEEIKTADEVFKTSAVMGVVPVVEVLGIGIAYEKPGMITKRIQAEYRKLIEKECQTQKSF